MSETTRALLKKLLVSRYATLVRQLERTAGSKDGAADALHETWLRLENGPALGPVANADAYILGIARNVVVDQHRREQRHVHEEEIDELLEIPDELADPERIVAARLKVEALKGILRGLTPRRRAILVAARVDGQLNREIAERFGISLRLVESELSVAMKYCLARMKEMTDPETVSTTGRRKF
jgi:RNA polymerase sigma factor (sigma-70 family)